MRLDFSNMPRKEQFEDVEDWANEFSIWFDQRANNPTVSVYKELTATTDIPMQNGFISPFHPLRVWKDDEEVVKCWGAILGAMPAANGEIMGPIPEEYAPTGSTGIVYTSRGGFAWDTVATAIVYPLFEVVYLNPGVAGVGWYLRYNTIFSGVLVNAIFANADLTWPHKEIY